jgi:hypothetical protein
MAELPLPSPCSFNPDGSARLWEYNADVARSEMYRLIWRLDLPIFLAESSASRTGRKGMQGSNTLLRTKNLKTHSLSYILMMNKFQLTL